VSWTPEKEQAWLRMIEALHSEAGWRAEWAKRTYGAKPMARPMITGWCLDWGIGGVHGPEVWVKQVEREIADAWDVIHNWSSTWD
jgi:hypothetical protein